MKASVPPLAVCGWMGLIFALSSRHTIPEPFGLASGLIAIGGHLTAYAILAILLWWALAPLDLSAPRRIALALMGAVIYGLSDEWHQSFVPGRDASVFDLAIDGIGACVGLGIVRIVSRSRAKRGEG